MLLVRGDKVSARDRPVDGIFATIEARRFLPVRSGFFGVMHTIVSGRTLERSALRMSLYADTGVALAPI